MSKVSVPKVSVIIPVYNTEPYLRRCLDSVCNQTLSDIEIICINDASPDRSSTLLHEYARNDARIQLIEFAENKGVSVARNAGLEAAVGEYIGFVDSDDSVDPDFFAELYAKSSDGYADIVKGEVREHSADGNVFQSDSNITIENNKFYFAYHFFSAMYRRQVLNDHKITFCPDLICGEDILFLIQAVANTNRIAISYNAVYHYMRRENSAFTENLNHDQIQSIAHARSAILDYINTVDLSTEEYIYVFNYHINWIFSLLRRSVQPLADTSCAIVVMSLLTAYAHCKYKSFFYSPAKAVFDDNDTDEMTRYVLANVWRDSIAELSAAPKVSIVVPVYNVAPYLKRGLDSLLNQALCAIEIICVNDASSDESLAILQEYARRDSRIQVIDLPSNQGSAVARNVAIEAATGDYIGFVDPDDYVDLDFFSRLHAKAAETGADIVKGRAITHEINGKVVYSRLNTYIQRSKFNFRSEHWSAIYSRKLVREYNMHYLPGLICGADIAFLIQAVTHARAVDTIPGTFYHYVRREDSAVSPLLTLEKIQSILNARTFIIDYARQGNVPPEAYAVIFNYQVSWMAQLQEYAQPDAYDAAIKPIADHIVQALSKYNHRKYFIQSIQLFNEGRYAECIDDIKKSVMKCKQALIVSQLRANVTNNTLYDIIL